MEQILHLINEMSPYVLLGFLLAGLMHAFIPGAMYSKYLSGRNFRSVVYAALLGTPLPLCSCGVIPTAMSLRREGASKGAVISFLIATPQTGVDSIIATYSLMGLPFAIVRPIVALMTALMGGELVCLTEGKEEEEKRHEEAAEASVSECGCGCGHEHCHEHEGLWHKIIEALEYAFIEMMEDIGKWLFIGLVIAGLITVLVPDSFFEVFKDNSLLSMLLVLCFSVPMYLCATGSIPIAVALMMKGLTPGAGLVLLMAGPACNMASILVINKVLGHRTLVTYLVSIILGAVGFGLAIDHLLPREWFVSSLVGGDACCVEETSWFSWCCTALLGLLLVNAMWRHYHGHGHCHCHGDEAEGDCRSGDCHCDDADCHCHAHTRTFVIKGMNCNHCRQNAQNALLSCPGVTSAEVDLATSKAVVSGEYDVEKLREAIESLGFTFICK